MRRFLKETLLMLAPAGVATLNINALKQPVYFSHAFQFLTTLNV